MKSDTLRVAWFSPLNVGKKFGPSKAAYFSDLVLPLIDKECEINLYHDSFEQYRDFPTYHYLKAFENDKAQPYDIIFYNLEDAKWCNFVRSHLGLIPGITYFHDFILSNYGPEPLLNSPYDQVINKFFERSIEWPIRDVKHLRKGPHAYREVAWSPVKIFATEQMHCDYKNVFNDRALDQAINKFKTFYLPYPVLERESSTLKHVIKKIGFCGSPRIECRSHKLLGSLKDLSHDYELIWLIESSERGEIDLLLSEFDIRKVTLVEGRSPHMWSELLSEIDIAIHTFFSVYGHPFPYLSISMKAGVPCIVSNFGSAEYLPSNLVFKIQPGESEAYQIHQVLDKLFCKELTYDPSRVVEYARESYLLESVVSDLVRIFNESAPELKGFREKWRNFESVARDFLIEESKNFVLTPPNTSKDHWQGLPFSPNDFFKQKIEPIFKELGWLL